MYLIPSRREIETSPQISALAPGIELQTCRETRRESHELVANKELACVSCSQNARANFECTIRLKLLARGPTIVSLRCAGPRGDVTTILFNAVGQCPC